MRSVTRITLWVLVAIGVVAALSVALKRHRAESANRSVAIIIDWDEVRALSEESSVPIQDTLRRFATVGATAVAIGEDTLGELDGLQRIQLQPSAPAPGAPAEMTTTLEVDRGPLRTRITEALLHKWRIRAEERRSGLTVPVSWNELSSFGIGVPPDVVAVVKAAGLTPVPRLGNFARVDQFSAEWAAEQAREQGASLVIFGGDQVLGYPDIIPDVARSLESNGLLFGQIEFGKQKGEDELAQALEGSLVRVHSISPVEMSRTSEADAVDRFLRAAQERNIRALYVRMLPGAPHPMMGSNVDYIRGIRQALQSDGLVIGAPHPYAPYDSQSRDRLLMGLGVGAATLLAMMYAWPASGLALTLVLMLAVLDVLVPALSIGRKLVALQGAIVFPVLAFLVLRRSIRKRQAGRSAMLRADAPLFGGVIRAVPLFLCASALSALGALFVVGMLSSRLGSMHIVDFWGIKAQQAGAILIVAAVFYLEISSRGGLAAARDRVSRRLSDIWSQPLQLGGLIVFFVALAVLALLLARSGNDPGVGVSATELKFRAVMDKVMGVRPRTKEFLIGHPALLLGIALMCVRRVRWGLPLVVIGAIGQVSIVNTFCHLHTPLAVSVVRVLNGVIAGIVVAVVVAWVIDRFSRRYSPAA